MMVYKHTFLATILIGLLLSLVGCGEKSGKDSGTTKQAESQFCIGCHEKGDLKQGNISVGTGKYIVDEWLASKHNSANAAGCADCHFASMTLAKAHENSNCSKCHSSTINNPNHAIIHNPDASGMCLNCHGRGTAHELPRNHFIPTKMLSYTSSSIASAYYKNKPVWGTMTSAAWVTGATEGKCTSCHNPHDNTRKQQHQDWAKSGHGNPYGTWAEQDFKTSGMTGISQSNAAGRTCVRCHTTTGYINYVTTGFSNVSAWGSSISLKDRSKQTLYCNACHYSSDSGRSYGYVRRSIGPVTGYYNYSVRPRNNFTKPALGKPLVLASIQFPDIGDSNLCLPCHTGRNTSGKTIKLLDDRLQSGSKQLSFQGYTSYYRNLAIINPHNFWGGATVFGSVRPNESIGYEFSDGQAFQTPGTIRDYSPKSLWAANHDMIGRDNSNATGTSGPCVGCHLSSNRSHTYKPMSSANGKITKIYSTVCTKCHTGYSPSQANSTKALFTDSMLVFEAMLKDNGIYPVITNPAINEIAFRTSNLTTSFTNWRKVQTFGSAYNYYVLFRDPGAFAHNPLYAKRLIYDSIDWLASGSKLAADDSGSFGAAGNVKTAITFAKVFNIYSTSIKANTMTYIFGGSGQQRP